MESIFEDPACLWGAEEPAVSPLIPAYTWSFPVAPQAVCLGRRYHAVAHAGEDGPALVWNHGLEGKRGDRAQEFFERLLAHTLGAQRVSHYGWRVGPEQVRGIDRRIACNGTIQIPLQRGEQRDHVAAQGVADRAYGRRALAPAQPRDEPPDVPYRLLARMQRVHHVARERPLTADGASASRTMCGENGHQNVQTQFLVQVAGSEEGEVASQGAHPYAVDADEPRACSVGVAQGPGVRGGVVSAG